jgi:fermentation-respiration switch protein FrsA (DUF1100 family)
MNLAKLSKRRRWLIATGIAFLCGLGVSAYVGSVLTAAKPGQVGSLPASYNSEDVTIDSASGSQLSAWYIDTPGAQATIVLLHPLDGHRRAMLKRLALMTAAGYAVLAIDFQACGMSPGESITMGYLESLDTEAAVAYARARQPTHKIGIIGWSLGGAATLLADDLQADAVVLECVYPTIQQAIHNRIDHFIGPLAHVVTPLLTLQLPLRLGITTSDLRPIDYIADLGCPVLMLAGAADPFTPASETKDLFDAAKEPKRLSLFEGSGHTDLMRDDRAKYESEVLSFLGKHLP